MGDWLCATWRTMYDITTGCAEHVWNFLNSGVGFALAGTAAVLGAGNSVFAQAPAMTDITLPVDEASVITELTEIGATILLLVFGISVAFSLAWKLFRRSKAAL